MRYKYVITVLMSLLVGAIISLTAHGSQTASEVIKKNFEEEYQAYCEALRQEQVLSHRSMFGPRTHAHLRNIIELGPGVLPYLIEKIEAQTKGKEDLFLTLPLSIITMKRFEIAEWPKGSSRDSRAKVRLYVQWWKRGRKDTSSKFYKYYDEWKVLKAEGKVDKVDRAKEKYRQICRLGIAALPLMVEKVRQGDTAFISAMSKLSNGRLNKDAKQAECLDWWEKNKENWLIPFPNKKPIANAGQDQTVTSGNIVQLDGSASSDADKDELTYRWTQIAGPLVKLSDEATVKPTFTAPEVQQPTLLIFQLTVEDGSPIKAIASCESGRSKPDIVTITVNPRG